MYFDWLISVLVIFPCEKYEIVGCTSLKFLVGDCFKMLSIVLADTWIVSSDDNIPRFVDMRLERGQLLLGVFDNHGVWEGIGASSWNSVVVFRESLDIGSEWPVGP